MPRPGHGGVPEKSKDFKKTIKRLFYDLNNWRKYLIAAAILAFLSALLSTIAPNRLSKIANVISDGLKPNEVAIKEIYTKIYENIQKNYILNIDISKINQDKESYIISSFFMLSDAEKGKILEEFKYNNNVISVNDQISFLNAMSNFNSNDNSDYTALENIPLSIQESIKGNLNMSLLKKRVIYLAIIYVLGALFGYFEGILMAYLSNGYAKSLRTSISFKINKLPLKYFDKHETGDVLSRVTNDIDTVGTSMNQSVSTLVASLTLFLGSIVMMFVTNWVMALTAIFSSIFGFVFSGILIKKSQVYFSKRQEELGKINAHIEEMYSGHMVVKAYNGEDKALKEFDAINERLYKCNRKSQFLSGIMQPLMHFIGNFGYVAVCVVGALLVINNKTSFGTIVAFMIYIRLFTNPLSQIAQALTSLQSTAAAAERVFEFIDEEEMSRENDLKSLDKNEVKGNIEFKNVHFGYDDSREIIKNFSASVKAGEKIAIVGPTGAGKTTIVNLLMKFYEINKGDIVIDGVSIGELTRENIHDLFVMVLQDTWLFDGTIEENIRYNKKNVSEEDIWKACETVGIDHFIRTLPNGLKTLVGDNDMISSGQKQLITIARGMIENSPFLILDEATSNVDTRTEELVQKAMDKLTIGKTSFIIAHRLSTIKNADLILVMNEGNIIEQGNHEELLKQNGFYANLYNLQFQTLSNIKND